MNVMVEHLVRQAGGIIDKDRVSISTKDLEKFTRLVIQEYRKETSEDRRETKRTHGYSRIGRNNV